jgi:chaperonin GroES
MSKVFVALGQNVFVEEQVQEQQIGSLYIPDSLDVDFTFGKVVSCDAGFYQNGTFIPSPVEIGDVVCFPKISGTKVTLNGKKVIRVYASDIVAKEVEGE